MNRNECINCKYYEKCGKPSRPVKCMGYELIKAYPGYKFLDAEVRYNGINAAFYIYARMVRN